MKDQPTPDSPDGFAISVRPEGYDCKKCACSESIRPDRMSVQRILICRLFPPTPAYAAQGRGIALLPAVRSPLQENEWCWQFKPRTKN